MADDTGANVDVGKFRDEILAYRDEAKAAVEQTATEFSLRQRTQVRAHVTRVLVYFFVGYLVVLAGLVVFSGVSGSGTTATSGWKDRADVLIDVLKSGILPVITFVLGHYFGSEGK